MNGYRAESGVKLKLQPRHLTKHFLNDGPALQGLDTHVLWSNSTGGRIERIVLEAVLSTRIFLEFSLQQISDQPLEEHMELGLVRA